MTNKTIVNHAEKWYPYLHYTPNCDRYVILVKVNNDGKIFDLQYIKYSDINYNIEDQVSYYWIDNPNTVLGIKDVNTLTPEKLEKIINNNIYYNVDGMTKSKIHFRNNYSISIIWGENTYSDENPKTYEVALLDKNNNIDYSLNEVHDVWAYESLDGIINIIKKVILL